MFSDTGKYVIDLSVVPLVRTLLRLPRFVVRQAHR